MSTGFQKKSEAFLTSRSSQGKGDSSFKIAPLMQGRGDADLVADHLQWTRLEDSGPHAPTLYALPKQAL